MMSPYVRTLNALFPLREEIAFLGCQDDVQGNVENQSVLNPFGGMQNNRIALEKAIRLR